MTSDHRINRRQAIATTTAAAATGLAFATSCASEERPTKAGAAAKSSGPAVKKGQINQSVVQWCFKDHWDVERTCQVAKDLGCRSVELVAAEHWPTLKKYGLVNACCSSH